MRVVGLSDHVGDMLREERGRRGAAGPRPARLEAQAARQSQRLDLARQARDQARAQRLWGAWLRGALAVWRERRRVPVGPAVSLRISSREGSLAAGAAGERQVTEALGRVLGGEWTLFEGYRNRRGEIDRVLLGPGGLFAIEVKHWNATMYCTGDKWSYIRYDKHGNEVGRGDMTDKRDRSPSLQLNEPASDLEAFLRSRGHEVAIRRILVFTHPEAKLGHCTKPTVQVAPSVGHLVRGVRKARPALAADQLKQLERLIIADHQHHEKRRR